MGQRLKYKLRKFLENPFYKRGEFYVKSTFTIFCIALFVLLFCLCDGIVYFENIIYAKDYVGDPFQMHVIDVENGDSILIHTPTNETILIDTGSERYHDRVESYIKQYFHYEKANSIDYLILTHSDEDHTGNAISLMKKFEVKNIIRPIQYSKYEEENSLIDENYSVSANLTYNEVIKFAIDREIEMTFADELDTLSFGDCKIKFLQLKSRYYSNENNYSIIFKLTYSAKSFLFMGDAESKVEEEMIDMYGDELKADVLKVGHHGSKTSSSQKFLQFVNPQITILSCADKSTILPSIEVVDRLTDMQIKIASTANEGNFSMRVNNSEVEFAKAKRKPNYLVIILTIEMILVFIVWKSPFYNPNKKNYYVKGRKFD